MYVITKHWQLCGSFSGVFSIRFQNYFRFCYEAHCFIILLPLFYYNFLYIVFLSVRRVYTNADVEDFFLKQERLTPKIGVRDKVTAVISSIRGELPNDASLEEDEDVLVRKLERYHDVRRNLFKSEKKDSGKKNIELWRKKSCLEISYSKNGRRKKPLGFQEEIRELIEKYALKESVNKLDVLASVIEECNQTWKEDQGS